MTVKEFVEQYNAGLKISEVIKVTYLPLVNKINLCERVINASYYKKNEDETKSLLIDSIVENILFKLSIIKAYTTIDVDFKDIIEEYDLLAKNQLIDAIMYALPDNELAALGEMLVMKEKDTIQNEYEIHAFISNQVERFGTLAGVSLTPILEKLAEVIENVDVEKLAKALDKLDKVEGSKIVSLFK